VSGAAETLAPDWRIVGVGALMTTRAGGVSAGRHASMNLGVAVGDDPAAVAVNRARFAEALGAAPVFLRQVHGARVVRIGAPDAAAGAPLHDADAAVTSEAGVACVVQAADCLPVLLAARNGRAVGAAHAGWRGLSAGIAGAAVAAVCEVAQCRPGEVDAWLGACIGADAFEVGADVLSAFGAEPVEGMQNRRFKPKGGAKWLADLPGIARDQLQAAGVERVTGGGWCTLSDASRFFSFRRDGVTGRMAAAIWIQGR